MHTFLKLTILRFAVVALLSIAVSPTTNAAIVYQIQDYPVWQQGHSLTGTITTTSSAPSDGLLDSGEILDWQFNVTGPQPFSASRSASSQTEVYGDVGITPTQITIGLPAFGSSNEFTLMESTSGTSGFLRYLFVDDLLDNVSQYEAVIRNETPGAGGVTRVQFDDSWQTFPNLPLPWVIAVSSPAVPEPSSFVVWAMFGLAVLYRMRQATR